MWPGARDAEGPQALTTFGAPLYGYDPTYDLAHIWLWETLRAQHPFLNHPAYVRERERSESAADGGAVDMGSAWGTADGGGTPDSERDKRASDSGGGGWLSSIGDFFSGSSGGGDVDGGNSDLGGGGSSDSSSGSSCGGGGCGGGSSD
jgi:hypothetical protein